jgi:hypothetical protein
MGQSGQAYHATLIATLSHVWNGVAFAARCSVGSSGVIFDGVSAPVRTSVGLSGAVAPPTLSVIAYLAVV